MDMAGQVHGKIRVIARIPAKGGSKWRCICDCGTPTEVWGHNLRTGNTTSCGCVKTADKPQKQLKLSGLRFGRLVAISLAPRNGRRAWQCVCDCGNKKTVRASHLSDGLIISCGCAANLGPFAVSRSREVRESASVKDHIRRQRKGVTSDWYDPDQIETLYLKQRRRCANCRCKISREAMHKDHIIALSKGGSNSIRNIQLLCMPCNRKKYNKDPIDFAREQGRLL